MLKLITLAVILLSASSAETSTESRVSILTKSPLDSLFYGFIYGMQLNPSTADSNPCLQQISDTASLRTAVQQSFLQIYKGLTNMYSFMNVMRQFSDSYNQELNICKIPTLVQLILSFFTLQNIGEYVIKYIVNSSTYKGYYNTMIASYMTGDYQTAGENAGFIFMGLTNFGI